MGAHRIMRSLLVIGTLLAVMAVSTFAEEKALEDDPVKEGERELAKMDTNKDGVADLSEVIAHMKNEFYKPEDNEKNKISPEQADTKSTADGKEYLEVLDANKDGKVTKDSSSSISHMILLRLTQSLTKPPMRMRILMQMKIQSIPMLTSKHAYPLYKL